MTLIIYTISGWILCLITVSAIFRLIQLKGDVLKNKFIYGVHFWAAVIVDVVWFIVLSYKKIVYAPWDLTEEKFQWSLIYGVILVVIWFIYRHIVKKGEEKSKPPPPDEAPGKGSLTDEILKKLLEEKEKRESEEDCGKEQKFSEKKTTSKKKKVESRKKSSTEKPGEVTMLSQTPVMSSVEPSKDDKIRALMDENEVIIKEVNELKNAIKDLQKQSKQTPPSRVNNPPVQHAATGSSS